MTVLLDTEHVAPQERADALHSLYSDEHPRRRVAIDGYPIRHRAERVVLGSDVQILRSGGSALHILRTRQEVREDAPEFVAIGLRRRGTGLMAVDDSHTELPVGQLNCVDMTSPYRLMHTSAHVHDVLIMSNQTAGVSVDVVRRARTELRSSPVYDLMVTHLGRLFAAVGNLTPATQAITGQSTVLLARALLLSAASGADGHGSLTDSLEVQITTYLDLHLHQPDLTVEKVAAVHHISPRHLYAVWSRTGQSETPAGWILSRRLERARHQLSGQRSTRISEIARANGFRDASHFSRRFRQRYGVSPREWRAAQ